MDKRSKPKMRVYLVAMKIEVHENTCTSDVAGLVGSALDQYGYPSVDVTVWQGLKPLLLDCAEGLVEGWITEEMN